MAKPKYRKPSKSFTTQMKDFREGLQVISNTYLTAVKRRSLNSKSLHTETDSQEVTSIRPPPPSVSKSSTSQINTISITDFFKDRFSAPFVQTTIPKPERISDDLVDINSALHCAYVKTILSEESEIGAGLMPLSPAESRGFYLAEAQYEAAEEMIARLSSYEFEGKVTVLQGRRIYKDFLARMTELGVEKLKIQETIGPAVVDGVPVDLGYRQRLPKDAASKWLADNRQRAEDLGRTPTIKMPFP